MVSQASKFEKKELDSRGEDRGERTDDGETFWLPGSFVRVPGCASWVSKGGGLRNVDLVRPLMLNKKISRTFQVNLSAKTRTSPFQDVSLVHSSKCRSKGERFCHLADLGDLALFSCTRNR